MSQELVDENVTDIFNPEEQMVLKQFKEMSSQLGAAPEGINVLGLLCLSTTERDFDLRCDESDNFKLLQFPGSFRACLCQSVNLGYKAFEKADSTMEVIRLSTGRVPRLLKSVLELLYDPEATSNDLKTYLPTNLKKIQKITDDCITEAKSVKEEFRHVLDFLTELQEATLRKQGKVEDAKRLTEKHMQWESRTESELKKQKEDVEGEMIELKQEYKEYKEKFDEILNEMPGVWSLAFGGLVDGVKNLFSSLSMMPLIPFVKIKSHEVEETESKNKDNEIHRERVIKFDEKTFSANPDELRSYLLDMSGLENAYLQLSSLFHTDRNSETTLCEKNLSKVIGYVKKELGHRIHRLGQKKTGHPISEKLVKTITTTLELTEELEQNKGNSEQLKQIKIEIEKYDKEIAALTLRIKSICNVPQLQQKRPKTIKSEYSTSVVANLVEGAYEKVEITKTAIEDTRKHEFETNKRRIQTINEMNDCSNQIYNLNYEGKQQESILHAISKGIDAFRDFQYQWSQLISFFSTIANYINFSMSEDLLDFLRYTNGTYNNNNTISKHGRKIVFLAANEAMKTTLCVHFLSEAYCEISTNQLVPLNNKLFNLLSLSSKKKEEIEQQRKQLNKDCLAVVKEIKSVINTKKQECIQNSKFCFQRLNQGFETIAPITQEEQNETPSNTLQMNNHTLISQESTVVTY